MTTSSSLESIFFAALEKHSLAERSAFLDQACAGDAELRRRVERMLAAQVEAGNFLESPAADPTETTDEPRIAEQPGTVIGPYKLLQQIGEGGMGVVFMAEQTQPVQRTVALKIIKPGMDTRQVIARFEAERQALAVMDHPHIAKVFDAGTTDTGRPYFVMELVKGVPITRYCDEHQITPRQRLELFVPICHAIQHAHQKGIIHRDLKPTNVLVAEYDEKPVATIIDFGIAKAIGPRLTDKTVFTEFGQVVGTIEYMSPEQAKLNQLDIDTRTDVYSLGVLLYELLTGETPVDRKRLPEAAFDEMLRMIREEEPPKPSTRLSSSDSLPSVAANRHVEPAKLTKLVRGELDWIVMKCLEKDRKRRYQTANELAVDMRRYLADEPVQAGPPSNWYALRKFARRNKWPMLAAVTIVTLLAAGVVGTTLGLVRARRAYEEANAAREQAEAVSHFLFEAFRKPEPALDGMQLKVVDLLDQAAAKLDTEFTGSPRTKGKLLNALGITYLGLGLPAKAIELLEKARSVRVAALGPEHLETLESMTNLGEAYRNAGRLEEAVAIQERAHADTPVSMSNLALAYQATGRHAEALPLLEESVNLLRLQFGPDHRDTLQVMCNLASAYKDTGRLAEALALHEEVLQRRKTLLGPDHPDTLESMGSLASAYRAAGRLPEAVPLFEEALRLSNVKLGPDHPDTLRSMNNLAFAYVEAGRLNEALPLYEETLKLHNAKLGADHPGTLYTMGNLAMAYQIAGRTDEALPLFKETLQKLQAKLGTEHPDTLKTMNNLGWAHLSAGRLPDALPLLEQAVQLGRARLGPDHPDLLKSMSNLGTAYLENGQAVEAESLLRECLQILESSRPQDWNTFNTQSMLGGSLLAQERYAEAEPLLVKGFEGLNHREDEMPANAKIHLTEALERLVRLYDTWGRKDEAENWRKKLESAKSNPP
jgi:serine/threonine protein kinase/Flp pilus assembly protein TadD